ncbi:hypothetical protein NXS19_005013 [Fusarium pseudograminearum]|nr:hypothetical protein NXS19_005013 [Fusarium pseudograminearum]
MPRSSWTSVTSHRPSTQLQTTNSKVAGDKLSYYALAGTLSKMNYAFRPRETEFIAYMRERSQMQGRNKPNRYPSCAGVDYQLFKHRRGVAFLSIWGQETTA